MTAEGTSVFMRNEAYSNQSDFSEGLSILQRAAAHYMQIYDFFFFYEEKKANL